MHVVTRWPKGDHGHAIEAMIREERAAGIDLALVVGDRHAPLPNGVEVMEVPSLRHGFSPHRDLAAARALRRLYRTWRPDVVHTHQSKAGILGRCLIQGVPCVIHTMVEPTLHRRAERWCSRRTDIVVTTSDDVRAACWRAGVRPRSDIITLAPPIEVGDMLRRAHAIVGRRPGSAHPTPDDRTLTDVAVVIPTHGRPETLVEALESVARQRLLPREVVVVDDMDDTRTASVVDAAARTSPYPVRRLLGPGGPSASRNLGYTSTDAPVVAFLDDDDRWEPDFLAAATALLAHADMVVSPASTFDGAAIGEGRRMPLRLRADDVIAVNPGFTGSNVVYRRSALDLVGGFDRDLRLSEDKDLLVRMLAADLRYDVLGDRLVARRTGTRPRLGTDQTHRTEELTKYIDKYRHRLRTADRRYLQGRIERVRRRQVPRGPRRLASTIRMLLLLGVSGVRRIREDERATRTSPK